MRDQGPVRMKRGCLLTLEHFLSSFLNDNNQLDLSAFFLLSGICMHVYTCSSSIWIVRSSCIGTGKRKIKHAVDAYVDLLCRHADL